MLPLPDFLKTDAAGCIWLTGHRVALHQLLWYYNEGLSPEARHD